MQHIDHYPDPPAKPEKHTLGEQPSIHPSCRIRNSQIGAWTAQPKSGTSDVDPYSRAVIARSGALPISLGDGVAFWAVQDDGQLPLDGCCEVVISGTTPTARYFTLTLYDPAGRLVANSLNRHGFTSEELYRRQDGSFEIAVAPRARAGNWLPTGGVDRYVLVLRFYDSSVGVATSPLHGPVGSTRKTSRTDCPTPIPTSPQCGSPRGRCCAPVPGWPEAAWPTPGLTNCATLPPQPATRCRWPWGWQGGCRH